MTNAVMAQLAALKTMPVAELKQRWRQLFDAEPPPYNRRFLESRLAYRVQELAYGGLSAASQARLRALAAEVARSTGAGRGKRTVAANSRPVAGTRLVREWQNIEHCVTVCDDGFEYQGQPYKSLSSIARQITGTRWNGWVFFGLKSQRTQS